MKKITLPQHLFLVSVGVGLLVPFVARLPNVPVRGWHWFTSYAPSAGGVLFLSAFNLLPALVLFGIGKTSRRKPLAYWLALGSLVAFLLWAHGTINLSSSSTAAIGLVVIPIYGVGAVIAGWLVGLLLHGIASDDGQRFQIAGITISTAIAASVFFSIHQSRDITQREARFPIVSVQEIPISKRNIYACCEIGSVETLAFDEFDSTPGNDIGVLGTDGIGILDPINYSIKSVSAFHQQDCELCVHMYPYLIPDHKGGVFVATSDGLSDKEGRLLWQVKSESFAKTVPFRDSQRHDYFVVSHIHQKVDLHDANGRILWSKSLPVSDVGIYVTADGQRLPFANTQEGNSRRLLVFSLAGELTKTIPLPEWAMNVQSIAWPKPGYLLVGTGGWISVLDPSGREVLRHVIQNTSFNPYHGPDGVAVRFLPDQEPYLVVTSHGSSGYARSVVLIFDPKGSLVWQEEINKLRSVLSIPQPNAMGEVLLIGNMDGVIEYSLGKTTASINQSESELREQKS